MAKAIAGLETMIGIATDSSVYITSVQALLVLFIFLKVRYGKASLGLIFIKQLSLSEKKLVTSPQSV
ncbi:MAG: hypothetical protein PUP46_05010 [Endozoicomonas sp. (ex Botrylloides leachii)]|nr:hypothetical protein [Endozoicomonas sp. (ex Botrylloides leachii)]